MNIAGLSLPIPSTRNHLTLIHVIFNMARLLLNNAVPPLTIPSTSNHPFICQGAFNRTRILPDIANIPLTILSTRNHHFHVYGAIIILDIACLSFTIESIWIIYFMVMLGVASFFWLLHPPGIISFLSMAPISCWLLLYPSGIISPTVQLQQARFLLGVAGLPLTIPYNRNLLCLLHEALSWARIIFKASALWADAFYKSICPYVRVYVCVFVHFWGTV